MSPSRDISLEAATEALTPHMPGSSREQVEAAAHDTRAALADLLNQRVQSITNICLRRKHRGSKAATRTVAAKPCPSCEAMAQGIGTSVLIVNPEYTPGK